MTAPPDPFAIAPDGAYLAVADGPELLVYRADGHPVWKQFCDDVLAGVAVTVDQVVTVDAAGTLVRWRREDGVELERQPVAGAPRGLIAASDGTLAVLTTDGPVLVRVGQGPRLIGVPGASAIGFGPDGSSIGVGTASGTFTALDAITGGAWGQVQLPADHIAGVAWSSHGFWVATAGAALVLVQGDAQATTASIAGSGEPLGPATCAVDGLMAAAVCGRSAVAAFDLHAHKLAGALTFRRTVSTIAFGPGPLLGIGLDDGDATLVDMLTGSPLRTEPHQGRGRNVWRMEDKVDHGLLRGALAFHRAGAEPIARYIPRPDPYGPPGGGGWMGACMGCLGVFGVTALFCILIVVLMYVVYATGLYEAIPIR